MNSLVYIYRLRVFCTKKTLINYSNLIIIIIIFFLILLMSSAVVDKLQLNLKCRKQGHENMPIIYVCNIGSCKDRLSCATCLISTHVHHEKNLINIKEYLN